MYLKDLYKNGYNIMQYLRDKKNIDNNDIYSICCAYDMQSGSYIKNYEANINSDEQIMVTTAIGGGIIILLYQNILLKKNIINYMHKRYIKFLITCPLPYHLYLMQELEKRHLYIVY